MQPLTAIVITACHWRVVQIRAVPALLTQSLRVPDPNEQVIRSLHLIGVELLRHELGLLRLHIQRVVHNLIVLRQRRHPPKTAHLPARPYLGIGADQ